MILPAEQFISGETKWSKIPGYTSLSPQILLSVFSDPVEITAGEELRLWYGEDLANKDEDDNEGKVCADVYGLYVWTRLGVEYLRGKCNLATAGGDLLLE